MIRLDLKALQPAHLVKNPKSIKKGIIDLYLLFFSDKVHDVFLRAQFLFV